MAYNRGRGSHRGGGFGGVSFNSGQIGPGGGQIGPGGGQIGRGGHYRGSGLNFSQGGGGRGSQKNQTPCRDFQRDGRCPRGNSCHFAHISSLSPSQPFGFLPPMTADNAGFNTKNQKAPCRDFQRDGRCPRGNNCRFAHTSQLPYQPSGFVSPMIAEEPSGVTNANNQKKPCRDFQRLGRCPRGNNCRFAHIPSGVVQNQSFSSHDLNQNLGFNQNLSFNQNSGFNQGFNQNHFFGFNQNQSPDFSLAFVSPNILPPSFPDNSSYNSSTNHQISVGVRESVSEEIGCPSSTVAMSPRSAEQYAKEDFDFVPLCPPPLIYAIK